jgi:predicted DCC family thiol-disulfide oxidoreductase YuxK
MNAGAGTNDMELTVWFDGDCGLCRRVARWLDRQPKFVPLHCVAAQSQTPDTSCPLDTGELLDRLTVTASDGAVYRGTKAWIMCLWALREYRGWSLTLSQEALWPWARRLYAAITGVASLTKPGRRRS